VSLLGTTKVMNLMVTFGSVSAGNYASFVDSESEKRQTMLFRNTWPGVGSSAALGGTKPAGATGNRNGVDDEAPARIIEHRDAFSPNGI